VPDNVGAVLYQPNSHPLMVIYTKKVFDVMLHLGAK